MDYSGTLARRSDRESYWLLKHFFYPLLGGIYYYPEDFWLGKDELWDFTKDVGYRFLKIWFCAFLNVYCFMFLVSFLLHVFVCIMRPDYVSFFELLSTKKVTGVLFLMSLGLSIVTGLIFAIENCKSKSIRR